jgi:DNA-binding MarR family transcriptional regulator
VVHKKELRMTISEIRRFRRSLRQFERLNQTQLKSCCARVTLAQCLVLLEIDESGDLTMSQLASRLRLDNSTLSRTIEGLVQRQLVARSREDLDRRVVRLRLTGEGHAVCRSIHEEHDGYYIRVFEKMPESRHAAIIKNFETLVQALLDCEIETMSGASCVSPVSTGEEDSP